MKKNFFMLMAVCVVLLTSSNGFCDSGSPTELRVKSSPECMAKIKSKFDQGEKKHKEVALKKGETYMAVANGGPRAGNIKLRIMKDGEEYVFSNGYFPKFCFKAPASGSYIFEVWLETTLHESLWANVNACFYKTDRCH